MKKTIALMLAMLFAVCAFVTTAFAEGETTTTTTTTVATTEATTEDKDAPQDGFNTTTTVATTAGTTAANTTAANTTAAGTTAADTTKAETTTELIGTLKPGETAYEGQGDENKTTTKKPAAVDTTIPSTGSGIVVPAIALAVLAAGTVAVIKTKKED